MRELTSKGITAEAIADRIGMSQRQVVRIRATRDEEDRRA